MIFKENNFRSIPVEKLYKSQMNGLNDSSIPEFNPVLFSTTFKDEFRDDESQEEYIRSYLKSAFFLSEKLDGLEKPRLGINKAYYNYSLTLPIIYLCRHSLELSIKFAISRTGGQPKRVHDLEKLWSSLLSMFPKQHSGKERSTLKNMGQFISSMNLLDDTGTKLRYPKERDGNYSQNQFMWANAIVIVSTTEKFIQQLNLIDIDNIRSLL